MLSFGNAHRAVAPACLSTRTRSDRHFPDLAGACARGGGGLQQGTFCCAIFRSPNCWSLTPPHLPPLSTTSLPRLLCQTGHNAHAAHHRWGMHHLGVWHALALCDMCLIRSDVPESALLFKKGCVARDQPPEGEAGQGCAGWARRLEGGFKSGCKSGYWRLQLWCW